MRRAEVFLEQVDESVAQASRRLVVEGATGAVNENETELLSDEDKTSFSRSSSIPTAESRTRFIASEAEDPPNVEYRNDTISEQATLKREADAVSQSEATANSEQFDQDHQILGLGERLVSVPSEVDSITESKFSREQVDSVDNKTIIEAHADGNFGEASTSVLPSPSLSSKMSLAENIPDEAINNSPLVKTGPTDDDEFIIALKAENAELRSELESIEIEFEKSRRERGKLVKNMKRMKEVISEMDETLRDKSMEVRQLEERLMQSKEQLETWQATHAKEELRSKEAFEVLRKDMSSEISQLKTDLSCNSRDNELLRKENERLKEALLQGNEVDLAAANGARQEASQAHLAYEAEAKAHRETRRLAREREEALQEEAVLATRALAVAQRKAEESVQNANDSRSTTRSLEAKLTSVTEARDAAFARISDLEESLRLFERNDGEEAPGQREAKAMQQTVSELENALEAKNLELNRMECEIEALRSSARTRRDAASPRTSGPAGAGLTNSHELEMKLRHMADASLRKQGQLEGLRSENRALQHQLTAERKRTREAQAMAAAASSSRQSIRGGFRSTLESGEGDHGDRIFGVRDGPLARFRTPRNCPKPIAKVIGALDRASAQVLAFLRKEPLLRLFVLVYAVAIHLFVYSLLHWHVETVTRGQLDGIAGGKRRAELAKVQ